jgi:Chaperone of endosialidase
MPIGDIDTKINAINGVTFRWKDTGKIDMGFIAQDIEKVLPEIVHTDTKGMKSVEYANITALLIEGYKYQKTRADSLETRVSALEKASK